MQALLDDLHDYNRTRFGMGILIKPAAVDAALVLTDELNLLRAPIRGARSISRSAETRAAFGTVCASGKCSAT